MTDIKVHNLELLGPHARPSHVQFSLLAHAHQVVLEVDHRHGAFSHASKQVPVIIPNDTTYQRLRPYAGRTILIAPH